MKSPLLFLAGIICTAIGVATVFLDVPFLGNLDTSKFQVFFHGFLLGLGPVWGIVAFVRRKQGRELLK
ncbi:hypothetical protein [Rufibacter ruber]|uniref:hypothetical protein n=1 Tax=Rufibacter ruber TaxID=1783499 RepID=UPI000829CC61|nr:hypothetical protein [Rufibacter ruber]